MGRYSLFIIAVVILVVSGVLLVRMFFPAKSGDTKLSKVRLGTKEYAVELATSMTMQARGLAYRDSLDADAGMLFIFSKPKVLTFVMQGMRFPLDIIWIRDGVVVDISSDLPPDKGMIPKIYSPSEPADWVLELNAGVAARDGIKVGDVVEYIDGR